MFRRFLWAAAAVGLVAAVVIPLALAATSRPAGRVISWSGYTWDVRTSDGDLQGPGPNYFSDSKNNVWVDGKGRLHLKITRTGGRWYSAEVTNTQSLGYGRYSWTLGSSVGTFDQNVTLGLFTWNDDPAFNNREIDIEVSRFGDPSLPANAGWTVQPWQTAANGMRFNQPSAGTSIQSFRWAAGAVDFATSGSPGGWSYTGPDVPPAGGEHPHINLWLFRGHAPKDKKQVEVILRSFTFTP